MKWDNYKRHAGRVIEIRFFLSHLPLSHLSNRALWKLWFIYCTSCKCLQKPFNKDETNSSILGIVDVSNSVSDILGSSRDIRGLVSISLSSCMFCLPCPGGLGPSRTAQGPMGFACGTQCGYSHRKGLKPSNAMNTFLWRLGSLIAPRLHPTACKQSNCKVHAFTLTGVFATTTRHLVAAKEMTLPPPNIPVSHRYCPWCCGFWWTVGAAFSLLWTIYFSLPHIINPSVGEDEFLGYHWNNILVQGVVTSFWQREKFPYMAAPASVPGCCLDPSGGEGGGLSWHLEGVTNKGCTWELGWVPDGMGTAPNHRVLWNTISPRRPPPPTHNPLLSGSSLKWKSSMFF